jgi:L-aspartate oxidase
MIPVAPAAHYSCGGIKTDAWGRSSIKNLYACGECASTGLHGANRLASNSLLEALVFAHRCFMDATDNVQSLSVKENVPDWNARGTSEPKEMILITQSFKEIRLVMSDYVGIVRNDIRLNRAMRRLDLLWEETEQLYQTSTLSPQLLELRNMISVGYLIVKAATFRKESRGLHFNTDYPFKSELVQNIVL